MSTTYYYDLNTTNLANQTIWWETRFTLTGAGWADASDFVATSGTVNLVDNHAIIPIQIVDDADTADEIFDLVCWINAPLGQSGSVEIARYTTDNGLYITIVSPVQSNPSATISGDSTVYDTPEGAP